MRNTFHQSRYKPHFALLVVCVMGLVLTALATPIAYAATFTVTKTADTNDGTCNTDCSLREAIRAANSAAGSDTIELPSGVYSLSIAGANEDAAATGDLDITGPLTINVTGSINAVIDGGGLDRVFSIVAPSLVGVTFNNVMIQNGLVAESGGGVFIATNGNLTLNNSTVQLNRSTGGDGGGGLYIQGTASLNLVSSSVISNTAATSGGGGIKNNSVLSVVNSTISANTTSGVGGGLANNGQTGLNNVTLANNQGALGAGGILSGGGGTTVNIRNTILAGNTANNQPSECQGTLNGQGYNLIQNVNGCTVGGSTVGNITGVSPNLLPLANNGGATLTHALPTGSLAIDTGNPQPGVNNACSTTDQRGVARPKDGDNNNEARCDMGSYEFELQPPTPTATATSQPTATATSQPTETPTATTNPLVTATATATTVNGVLNNIYLPLVQR